jgi:hypothetical protein
VGRRVVADAIARPGTVGVAAYTSATASPTDPFIFLAAGAGATMVIEDLFITGPATETGYIDAILNLQLTYGTLSIPDEFNAEGPHEGIATGIGGLPEAGRAHGFATIDVSGHAGLTSFAAGITQCVNQASFPVGVRCPARDGTPWIQVYQTTDWLLEPDLALLVQLPIGLKTSVGFSMSAQSEAGAEAIGFNLKWGHGSSIFNHTLSFPSGSPLFTLPEGYTATSVDGRIVDNMWLGLEDDPTAIPEPTSMMLLGSGLLGFVARRRRKRK